MSSTSAIWSPTFMTGLSAVIGSWKIMPIRAPRILRIAARDFARMSSPSSSTRPPATVNWRGGSSAMMAWAVTDWPEPDSPSTHTISPGLTAKDTFSTALIRSAPPGRRTVRPCTSSTGFALAVICMSSFACRHLHPPCKFRVEPVAQAVAQHIDGKHRQGKANAGEEDIVRINAKEPAPLRHDVAPGGRLGRNADAEKRQNRLDQNGVGADECSLHDECWNRVRQDVAHEQQRCSRAGHDRGLDIGLLAHRQHDGAHEAHDARYLRNDDGDDDADEAGTEQRDQCDRKQDRRDRHQPVHQPHHDGVDPAQVTGDEADEEPDRDADHRHRDADQER